MYVYRREIIALGRERKGCALLPALEQNSSRPLSALAYQVTLIKCSVQRTFLDMFRSAIMRTRKTHRWQAGTGKAQHNNDNPRRLLRWPSSPSPRPSSRSTAIQRNITDVGIREAPIGFHPRPIASRYTKSSNDARWMRSGCISHNAREIEMSYIYMYERDRCRSIATFLFAFYLQIRPVMIHLFTFIYIYIYVHS